MGRSREVELRVSLGKVSSATMFMRGYYRALVDEEYDSALLAKTGDALDRLGHKAQIAHRAISALDEVMVEIEELMELEGEDES